MEIIKIISFVLTSIYVLLVALWILIGMKNNEKIIKEQAKRLEEKIKEEYELLEELMKDEKFRDSK